MTATISFLLIILLIVLPVFALVSWLFTLIIMVFTGRDEADWEISGYGITIAALILVWIVL